GLVQVGPHHLEEVVEGSRVGTRREELDRMGREVGVHIGPGGPRLGQGEGGGDLFEGQFLSEIVPGADHEGEGVAPDPDLDRRPAVLLAGGYFLPFDSPTGIGDVRCALGAEPAEAAAAPELVGSPWEAGEDDAGPPPLLSPVDVVVGAAGARQAANRTAATASSAIGPSLIPSSPGDSSARSRS